MRHIPCNEDRSWNKCIRGSSPFSPSSRSVIIVCSVQMDGWYRVTYCFGATGIIRRRRVELIKHTAAIQCSVGTFIHLPSATAASPENGLFIEAMMLQATGAPQNSTKSVRNLWPGGGYWNSTKRQRSLEVVWSQWQQSWENDYSTGVVHGG